MGKKAKKTNHATAPELGAVHTVKLFDGVDDEGAPRGLSSDPKLEGIEVDLQYVGPEQADEWVFQNQAGQLAEVQRMAEFRKGLNPQVAPELFDGSIQTEEGLKANVAAMKKVLGEAIVGARIRGDAVDGEELGGFIASIPMGVRVRLMAYAMEVQQLRLRHVFLASDPGDVGSELAA